MPTFDKILKICWALSDDLDDIVFIGGVAVYLHAVKRASDLVPPEASHDADFMISFEDYGTLKDLEEIVPNTRLAKHQMVVENVELDVYVERLNRLVVPYDEVFANSTTIDGTRVACLEHLLVLKLEALMNRGHSSKGEKDRRDVAKIGLLLKNHVKKSLVEPYLRPDTSRLLTDVAKSSVFFDLCAKNAHLAKKARASFTKVATELARD